MLSCYYCICVELLCGYGIVQIILMNFLFVENPLSLDQSGGNRQAELQNCIAIPGATLNIAKYVCLCSFKYLDQEHLKNTSVFS